MQYDSLPADNPEVVRERQLREQDRLRRLEHDREQLKRQNEEASEQDNAGGPDDVPPECCFGKELLSEFNQHAERLRKRSRARRQAMTLKSTVLDREDREQASAEDLLGRRQPQDEFQGDVNMRTLQALLKMIDEKGFERSPHQVTRSTLPCMITSFCNSNTPALFHVCTAQVPLRLRTGHGARSVP